MENNISTMVNTWSKDYATRWVSPCEEDGATMGSSYQQQNQNLSTLTAQVNFLEYTKEIAKLFEALVNPLVHRNRV